MLDFTYNMHDHTRVFKLLNFLGYVHVANRYIYIYCTGDRQPADEVILELGTSISGQFMYILVGSLMPS